MSSIFRIFVALMLVAVVTGCSAENRVGVRRMPFPGTGGSGGMADGNNRFALEFYGKIRSGNEESNLFFSPVSISSALAMAYVGARGETAVEMERVLHYGKGPAEIAPAYHAFLESLLPGDVPVSGEGEPFSLAIANGLWVQRGFNLLDGYRQVLDRYFGATAENLDFRNDPEGARSRINEWVAEKTMDRITDLVPPGMIGAMTRVVLTNAVYFKASWEFPFEEFMTSDERFLRNDGSVVEVPMMRHTEFYDYVEKPAYKAVKLPYEGGSAYMLIVLPEGDILRFGENLDRDLLRTVEAGMARTNLTLILPRFEFSCGTSLGSVLRDMGMGSAFDDRADFSGVTGRRDLFISEVLHKAFVKVDEGGTEAAAATAVVMNLTSMPEPALEMMVNRPFLFFIVDSDTRAILFMGRVMDPSAES